MANPLVQILIKAKDEASEVIEGIAGKFEDLGEGADDLKEGGSKSFGDFMDNVAIAMLGINQAIEVGMKIAEAAKAAYEATVGKALTVAEEVETLARVSGDAPEAMSSLRIAAQEAKVSFEDLYKAMENLNKNGVSPTIENLVSIATEYVKLEDPIEKAALLTENFGSAGDEIAPMLEAIAGGVKKVQNAGAIFTQEDIQAASEYEAQLAALKTEWELIGITLGKAVIPKLTEFLQLLNYPVKREGDLIDFTTLLTDAFNQGAIDLPTYNELLRNTQNGFLEIPDAVNQVNEAVAAYNELMLASGDSNQKALMAIFNTTSSYEEFRQTAHRAGLDIAMMNEEIYNEAKAAGYATTIVEALTEAEILEAEAAALAAAEQEKLNTALTSTVFTLGQKYTPILDDIADKQGDITELNKIIAEGGGVFDGVAISAADAQIKVNGLTDEINASIDAMKAMAAQAVAGIAWDQITADGKLTMDEITRYYDYLVNTGLMSAEAGQLATQNLINAWSEWDPEMKQLLLESLLDTTEVDDYVPESKEFPVGARVDPSEFDGWTPEQKEFWLLIRPETSEIDDYEPPTLTGTVNYVIGNMPHIPEAAGGAVHAAASGVAASLPHYWVGELGPEPFFPAQNGRIVSNTQALAALRGGAGADSKEIADAVKKGVKEAMRDGSVGSVYNLTMPTSSNPADIRMAFELMEAWGT